MKKLLCALITLTSLMISGLSLAIEAPTNVQASDGIGNTINVTWDAVSGATNYYVYRNGVGLAYVNTNQYTHVLDLNVQGYAATGVFSVKAFDELNNELSSFSNEDYGHVNFSSPQVRINYYRDRTSDKYVTRLDCEGSNQLCKQSNNGFRYESYKNGVLINSDSNFFLGTNLATLVDNTGAELIGNEYQLKVVDLTNGKTYESNKIVYEAAMRPSFPKYRLGNNGYLYNVNVSMTNNGSPLVLNLFDYKNPNETYTWLLGGAPQISASVVNDQLIMLPDPTYFGTRQVTFMGQGDLSGTNNNIYFNVKVSCDVVTGKYNNLSSGTSGSLNILLSNGQCGTKYASKLDIVDNNNVIVKTLSKTIANNEINNLSWTIDPAKTYTLKISAKDTFNNVTKTYSLPIAANAINFIEKPTVTASKGTIQNQVNLTWSNVNGSTSYEVYRNGIKIGETTQNNYLDSFTINSIYAYQVKAIGVGLSSLSDRVIGYGALDVEIKNYYGDIYTVDYPSAIFKINNFEYTRSDNLGMFFTSSIVDGVDKHDTNTLIDYGKTDGSIESDVWPWYNGIEDSGLVNFQHAIKDYMGNVAYLSPVMPYNIMNSVWYEGNIVGNTVAGVTYSVNIFDALGYENIDLSKYVYSFSANSRSVNDVVNEKVDANGNSYSIDANGNFKFKGNGSFKGQVKIDVNVINKLMSPIGYFPKYVGGINLTLNQKCMAPKVKLTQTSAPYFALDSDSALISFDNNGCDNSYATKTELIGSGGNIIKTNNGTSNGVSSEVLTFDGLDVGSYTVRVTTVDNVSNETKETNLSFNVIQMAAPSNIVASKGTLQNQVSLSWDAVSGATSYEIYREDVKIGTTSETNYLDSFSQNSIYKYQIIAKSTNASSVISNPVYGYGTLDVSMTNTYGTFDVEDQISMEVVVNNFKYRTNSAETFRLGSVVNGVKNESDELLIDYFGNRPDSIYYQYLPHPEYFRTLGSKDIAFYIEDSDGKEVYRSGIFNFNVVPKTNFNGVITANVKGGVPYSVNMLEATGINLDLNRYVFTLAPVNNINNVVQGPINDVLGTYSIDSQGIFTHNGNATVKGVKIVNVTIIDKLYSPVGLVYPYSSGQIKLTINQTCIAPNVTFDQTSAPYYTMENESLLISYNNNGCVSSYTTKNELIDSNGGVVKTTNGNSNGVSSETFSFNGLGAGSYVIKVTTTDVGNNEVNVTTLPFNVIGIDPPGNVNATDGTITNKVKVSWDAAENAQGYRVFKDGVQVGETTNLEIELDETNPTVAQYHVVAFAGSALSPASELNSGHPNLAPTATSLTMSPVRSGTPFALAPTVTDANADDVFTFSVLTQPAKGQVTVVGGKLQFTGNINFSGSDPFTYRVTDKAGATIDGNAVVNQFCRAPTDSEVLFDVYPNLRYVDVIPFLDPTTKIYPNEPVQLLYKYADSMPCKAGWEVALEIYKGTTLIDSNTDYIDFGVVNGMSVGHVWQGGEAGTYTVKAKLMGFGPEPEFIKESTFTVSNIVDAPANVSATDGTVTGKVVVTWDAVENATGYRVYKNRLWKEVAIGDTTTLRFEVNEANPTPANYAVAALIGGDEFELVGTRSGNDLGHPNLAPSATSLSLEGFSGAPMIGTPSVTDANENDTFVFSILSQPTSGTASIVDGKIQYLGLSSFHGNDNFSYEVTDKANGKISGVANVVQTCAPPTEDELTYLILPNDGSALNVEATSQQTVLSKVPVHIILSYDTPCSTPSYPVSFEIFKGNNKVFESEKNVLAVEDEFSWTAGDEGLYKGKLSLLGSGGEVLVSKEFNIIVDEFILPTLNKPDGNKSNYVEKADIFIATVDGSNSSCLTLTTDDQSIKTGECLVEFENLPEGIVANGLMLSGKFESSGTKTIKANIYDLGFNPSKITSNLPVNKKLIGSVEKVINVIGLTSGIYELDDAVIGDSIVQLSAINNLKLVKKSGTDCTLTTELTSALGKCLVEWKQLPEGIVQNIDFAEPNLRGFFKKSGDNVFKYDVSFITSGGDKIPLYSKERIVPVSPAPSPVISFEGGNLLAADTYGAPIDGGLITFINLDGSKENMVAKVLVDNVNPIFNYTARNKVKRPIIADKGINLWDSSVLNVDVAFTNPDIASSQKTLTAIVTPANAVSAEIVMEGRNVGDSELVPIVVKVGIKSRNDVIYDSATMGVWKVRVRDSNTNQYFSEFVTIDESTGIANLNIDVKGHLKMRLIPEMEISSPDNVYTVKRFGKPNSFTITKFTKINATLGMTRDGPDAGAAPFNALIGVTFDSKADLVSLDSIAYEYRAEGATEWIEQTERKCRDKCSITFDEGSYEVRAKLVNKNSELTSYTNVIKVYAYKDILISLDGEDTLYPGDTTAINILTKDGDGDDVDSLIEWEIENTNSRDKTPIAKGEGDNVAIQFNEAGKLKLSVKAIRLDVDNPQRSNFVQKSFIINYLPVAQTKSSIVGGGTVEVGFESVFEGKGLANFTGKDSGLSVMSEWILPTRGTVSGNILKWTPTDADLLASQAGRVTIYFNTWVDGHKENTISTAKKVVNIWKYTWPKFTLFTRVMKQAAPTDALVVVKVDDVKAFNRIPKGDLTYTWELDSRLEIKKGSLNQTGLLLIPTSGQFPIGVTISDKRGNSTRLTDTLSAKDVNDIILKMTIKNGSRYTHNPLRIFVSTTAFGGFPDDSVTEWVYKLDGNVVEMGGKNSGSISDIGAGSHVLEVSVNSRLGRSASTSATFDVPQNQSPSCEVSYTSNGDNTFNVKADCIDPEKGQIDLRWFINDVPHPQNQNPWLFGKDQAVDVIKLRATDQGGLFVEKEISIQ